MELAGDGLVIITYTAEPDSPATESLRFLAIWATNTPRFLLDARARPETHHEAVAVLQPHSDELLRSGHGYRSSCQVTPTHEACSRQSSS